MFARLGIWHGSPEEIGQWIKRGSEQVKPELAATLGLKAAYWLADRASGTGMIVTLWESEAAMQASEAERLKRQSVMSAVTGANVRTERYEVVDALIR
jgi:heme-degrading monooxygenase HmoA